MERFMTTKLSTEELRQAIAKLVVTCDLPFRIVESEAFRELLILLNRNCTQKNFIPSRWMVSRDTVVYATAALQSAIAEMLAKEGELGCKVSITIDMWTAPNNKAWLVVTGHWIDENFQLRTMVLEFREMLGRHGAREMAQVVEETIVQWGLEGRCLGFTTDNASSNIAAFRRMSEEGGGQCFFSSRMHFRCLAHVINLVVQAALAVDSIRKLLKILREMASWIGFSPQRSGSFLGLQRTLNLQANPAKLKPALKLVQDSPTRWGSTHDMVERAGVLQNPITVFFAQTQGLSNTDKKKVESLRLTDADWETLHAVKTFLSPFAKVSNAAEGAAYPTVSTVVPYYNGLIDAMELRLAKGPSPTLQPMIVAVLSHLKKYAYITSNEYWIATFLDPSMKAAWFDDAHWEKLHPETERRVRPRPASGEVIKLVRDRVAEYQARAAELAPRPTPVSPVAEEEDGDEEEDDDDAQFLPSRRQLAARLSASQEAGAGGMVQDGEPHFLEAAPPGLGIEAAALGAGETAALGASASATPGAGESAPSGSASAQVLHTFTLDSGASRSFFRDRTTLTPLSRPVAVSLADPSGGPVLASFSTVLPCSAAPSGSLTGLYLPSFSTNLVSGADLQDQGVDQFTPASQRVTHCTCARTGRHLATFTRQPGSSLYTLTTASPPVAASSQVFAAASGSGPESASCSCRRLYHQTLLWHHHLGHPSLPRLRGMASRVLVSGLPRSLPPLPPGPAPTCVPCVEGRQRAAPHSSDHHHGLLSDHHVRRCARPASESWSGTASSFVD
ncbi:unnamed protein product [Closterium sp. NIES-54]